MLGIQVHIGHRADGKQQLPDLVLGEARVLKCGADVARALAGPYDVAKPCRCVIESAYPKARIHRRCDECVATTQARTQNAELLEAFAFEPVYTASDICDGLATGRNRASNVCTYGVIRTL